jgi:hypothetical protein
VERFLLNATLTPIQGDQGEVEDDVASLIFSDLSSVRSESATSWLSAAAPSGSGTTATTPSAVSAVPIIRTKWLRDFVFDRLATFTGSSEDDAQKERELNGLSLLASARNASMLSQSRYYYELPRGDDGGRLPVATSTLRAVNALGTTFRSIMAGGQECHYCAGLTLAPAALLPNKAVQALQVRSPSQSIATYSSWTPLPAVFPPLLEADERLSSVLGLSVGKAIEKEGSSLGVLLQHPWSSSRFSLALVSKDEESTEAGSRKESVGILPFDELSKKVWEGPGSDLWLRAATARVRLRLEDRLQEG